jgi:prepilin-type N-terminal cleavage/methylation domain-containing protein/prepilin-type processing-associated H-X9-DG protein
MSATRPVRSTQAFTYIELLIVLVVIAVLVAIILPMLLRMRESQNRQRCARQLQSLGQALLMYSNDNKGAYPRTMHAAGARVIPTWGTGAVATDPFGSDGPAPHDVSAALFLLLRTQDFSPSLFVCPSSDQSPWDFGGGGRTALNWSNFSDVKTQLSYSYQNPYASTKTYERMKPFIRYLGSVSVEVALMSDMNPGAPGNSRNHVAGQNVLFSDGHVTFTTTSNCGPRGDNIFTAKLSENEAYASPFRAPPYDREDCILLPTSR